MIGVPERLYSDNGSQYNSPEFAKISSFLYFQNVTSIPHYKTAESLLNALLSLRNTPVDK